MRRLVTVTALPLVVASFLATGCGNSDTGGNNPRGAGPAVTSATRLNGGGSSFVDPMMQEWAGIYKKEKGTEINYQSVGSSTGISHMISKEYDFGGTDAPMTAEQLAKAKAEGGEVIHVPVVMGAVVPAYNLPDVGEGLKFSGPVLADIYLGKIKKWNDKALAELNPDAKLPDRDITVVHRADGSGTTYIWSDYLSKVSPEWKEKVGVATSVKWPTGTGQQNTAGVAGFVQRTTGAVGYVELYYALQNKIPYGSVKNKEGQFVAASLESVTAAAAASLKDIPRDLRFSLTDAPGRDAYPISGTTWVVLYVEQPGGKAKALADFLRWVTHGGQEHNQKLKYARIPKEMVALVDRKLDQIKGAK